MEMKPPKLASPVPEMTSAVMSEVPMEILPKPEPSAPEVRVPTVTMLEEPPHVVSAVFSTKFNFNVVFRLAVVVPLTDEVEGA